MERREGERDFAFPRTRLLSTTEAISLAFERDWLASFFVGELDFFFKEAEFIARFDVTVFLVVMACIVAADAFFF